MKIKTGDTVKVLSGKDKNQTGKVLQVLVSKKNSQPYVVIEGLNLRKKHIKARGGQSGQIIELPAPIHMSSVMFLDPKTKKPSRVGYTVEGTEKKRISKKSGEYID